MVNPAYFVNNPEALHMDTASETEKEIAPFAGMADVIEESLEQEYENQNWE